MHTQVSVILNDADCEPNSAKRQKVDEPQGKYSDMVSQTRYLQKCGAIRVGLKDTIRAVSTQLHNDPKSEKPLNTISHLMVFLIHDPEHTEMTRQVMIACRQAAINAPPIPHWVLPKFSKTEMTKIFGVKRLTCFTLDFSKMSDCDKVQQARDSI